MRWLDRVLRDWRAHHAAQYVPDGSDVLDIGGLDGHFLIRLRQRIRSGTCVDPLAPDGEDGNLKFLRQRASPTIPVPDESVDVVVMLATYEHLGPQREGVTKEAFRVLRPGGRLILTVPHSSVDHILLVLRRLGLIAGLSLGEHEHFQSTRTVELCQAVGFSLSRWRHFQLRLNNLFIFTKPRLGIDEGSCRSC